MLLPAPYSSADIVPGASPSGLEVPHMVYHCNAKTLRLVTSQAREGSNKEGESGGRWDGDRGGFIDLA